jgi:hypothetical protein
MLYGVPGIRFIPDAQTVAARWSQNTQAATQRYSDGVQATQKDQAGLAIAAGPKYLQNVTQAFNSGKWANGLRRVGTQGWKAATIAKAANFATGVGASEAKVASAFTPLLAYEQTLQNQVQSMPNVTLQDAINRATAWINGMARYQAPA